jgi:hypothetical protein
MALIDEVKAVCDRLAPLGWRDLLKAATTPALDIAQKTPQALQNALATPLSQIDRTLSGFEDFNAAGARGITPGDPSQSLLYHALASPRVLRDANGALLKGWPTLPEIEIVENFIFSARKATLDSIKQVAGGSKLAIVVFATEYRPSSDTADGAHADLTFSRTGIARIGTARPKYLPDIRGYWAEDEDNPHGFRVIPVRFTAWLAAPVKGQDARVMRLDVPDAAEKKENLLDTRAQTVRRTRVHRGARPVAAVYGEILQYEAAARAPVAQKESAVDLPIRDRGRPRRIAGTNRVRAHRGRPSGARCLGTSRHCEWRATDIPSA